MGANNAVAEREDEGCRSRAPAGCGILFNFNIAGVDEAIQRLRESIVREAAMRGYRDLVPRDDIY